jgi:hypothetical protein
VTWEPDYITAAELKSELRISDTDDDVQVARWVTSASRAVDNYCHRQFGQVAAPEARIYRPGAYDRHIGAYVLEIDDLYTTTGFSILDSSGNAVTNYELRPDNALVKGKPYERLVIQGISGVSTFYPAYPLPGLVSNKLTITGNWGWAAIPVSVKEATMLQAARLAARRDSPFGVAGSPTEGSEMRLLAKVDPDVETVIGKKFRREWWAA